MPYIKQQQRPQYDHVLDQIQLIGSKGELEYCVFKLMKIFMATRPQRFDPLHDVVYGVQHCADEYRTRFLDKRERKARKENGDIRARQRLFRKSTRKVLT
jgi:hypothetical protein